jgi:hypothetical protein
LSGAHRFRKVVPELEQSLIQHDQDAADIPRAITAQVKRGRGRVEILCGVSFSFAVEKLHSHEAIEEIGDTARVKFQCCTDTAVRRTFDGQNAKAV